MLVVTVRRAALGVCALVFVSLANLVQAGFDPDIRIVSRALVPAAAPAADVTAAFTASKIAPAREAQARKALSGLTLPFIQNSGQSDERVAFYAPTFAGTVFVTRAGEIVYSIGESAKTHGPGPTDHAESATRRAVLSETLVDAALTPAGRAPGSTNVSFLHGSDERQWQQQVRTFETLSLGEAWPGIEVSLKARARSVEKVFTVAPGTSPEAIRLALEGAEALRLANDGRLIAATEHGEIAFSAPIAFQEIDGTRTPVTVAYVLEDNRYGFALGEYDSNRPLVIDPILQSTFVGGDGDDYATALAIHPASGDVYVAGYTNGATGFPGIDGSSADNTVAGDYDAFIVRLPATLTSITQATFLGGDGDDEGWSLAIHPATGDVYLSGFTNSANFPGISGGADTDPAGDDPYEVFVARLPASLTSITQSTYLGGLGADLSYANSLAIHPATGDVYVTGFTNSYYTSPTPPPYYSPTFPGLDSPAPNDATDYGGYSVFVTRFPSNLQSITHSILFGSIYESGDPGYGADFGYAIAIHPGTGDVYVAGTTDNANSFSGVDGNSLDQTVGGTYEAFVSRLPSDLSGVTQSTFLGGDGDDEAYVLAIHPTTGDVYVGGYTTDATDFPGLGGGADTTFAGVAEGYVARLSSDLTSSLQATFIGGDGDNGVGGLAIDSASGDVFAAGWTDSSSGSFPGLAGGADTTQVDYEGFVTRFSASLMSIVQSTYLGGDGGDGASAIAIHPGTGIVYVADYTSDSAGFPAIAGGADTTVAGDEAYVACLTADLLAGAAASACSAATLPGQAALPLPSGPTAIPGGGTCFALGIPVPSSNPFYARPLGQFLSLGNFYLTLALDPVGGLFDLYVVVQLPNGMQYVLNNQRQWLPYPAHQAPFLTNSQGPVAMTDVFNSLFSSPIGAIAPGGYTAHVRMVPAGAGPDAAAYYDWCFTRSF